MLYIYLLGGFRVETGDRQPLPLPRVQGLVELWAYLVLHPQRPIPRDHLAFTLWPDEAEEPARAQLRRCLFHLRKLLPAAPEGRPWLLSEGRTLRWNPSGDCWLDVDQFRQTGGAPPDQEAARLELYGGDLLPELDAAWLLPLRQRLRDETLARLERLVEAAAQRGEFAAALRLTGRWLQAAPTSEAAQRRSMKLRYLAQDRVQALRQFDNYLVLLERQGLASGLSPETLALRQAIASGELALGGPPAPSAAPAAARPVSRPLRRRLPKTVRWRLNAGLLAALLALSLALAYFRPFAPLKTLTLRGAPAVQDTWISSTYPDTPYAAGPLHAELHVDVHDGRGWFIPHLPFAQYPAGRVNLGNLAVADTLLQFQLEALPPHSRVEKAWLAITLEPDRSAVEQKRQPRPVTLAAFRLLRPWDARTATFSFPWSEPGLRPGVDYDPAPLYQQPVASAGPLRLDLTAAFPAWQKGGNFGVLLMMVEAPAGVSAYWMPTTEHPDPALWPQLILQYR